ASKPAKKDYGILSVLLQAYYDIEYLFTVDEHVFSPTPKVKSAVVRLRRNDCKHLSCNENDFKHLVKTAFNQRRKTLRNSLKTIAFSEELLKNDIFSKRPEQLSVDDFVFLTSHILKT
ncbi:MAG: 16S rRNA (adenine(1518)-N(6)/adenine(1519)-N(6))-dimethyltransferase, partial [Bacteroidales bacterium]|nr:16S rRNA (adenine(1518)-N(6)/adenine(1519)-N(6))-dimethyltransferase [Bacteroidales bacterium]